MELKIKTADAKALLATNRKDLADLSHYGEIQLSPVGVKLTKVKRSIFLVDKTKDGRDLAIFAPQEYWPLIPARAADREGTFDQRVAVETSTEREARHLQHIRSVLMAG